MKIEMSENDSVEKFPQKLKQDSNHVSAVPHVNHTPLPSLNNQPVATTTTVMPPIVTDKDNNRSGAFGDVLPVMDDNLDVR